jgi:hypothetical protein
MSDQPADKKVTLKVTGQIVHSADHVILTYHPPEPTEPEEEKKEDTDGKEV